MLALPKVFTDLSTRINTIVYAKRIKMTVRHLQHHNFFNTANDMLDTWIPTICVDDPGRQLMLRDFIRIRVAETLYQIEQLIYNENIDALSPSKLRTLLRNTIEVILNTSDAKARSRGIPDVFLDKYRNWHGSQIERIMLSVDDFCTAPIYRTNVEKLYAVLTVVEGVLSTSVTHMIQTMEHLNGDLNGFVYRSIACGTPQIGHKFKVYRT